MYMIAFVRISEGDGISKKIITQAKAFSKLEEKCTLLCLDKNDNFQILYFENNQIKNKSIQCHLDINQKKQNRVNPFIKRTEQIIEGNPGKIYIRHMIPSLYFIKFLSKYRKNKIIYEIPTYPYFYEQYCGSKNKFTTCIRLGYEALFWPLIYLNINRLIAIPCRSKLKCLKKMRFITNASPNSDFINYRNKCLDSDIFLIGVGTIHKYHGYEKIINALSKYKGNRKVYFYIVGGGNINPLKELVKNLKIDDVVRFTGPLFGEQLEQIYDISTIGVGTMALEYRKADIDTGIKILDYYVHGLPVISSGICPGIPDLDIKPFYVCGDNIDLQSIIEWADDFDNLKRTTLANSANIVYSWDSVARRILYD